MASHPYHPSFGHLTRSDIERLNAMPDSLDYQEERKRLFAHARKLEAAVRREKKLKAKKENDHA